MADLSLTAAFGDYDRIAPLRDQRIRPAGIDLRVLTLGPSAIFQRMVDHLEFDVAEMSMGTLAYLVDRGEARFSAIPAFPSRVFRHSMVYANVDSGIERPEDLNGKRIAIREWGMTAVVWIVGILADEHGLDLRSIDWVAAIPPRVPIPMPDGARIRYMAAGENLSDMLESGAVDAALIHQVPGCFAAGSPRVRRVFADYGAAERAYWSRTGIHPIMHTTVIRDDVLARDRWVAASLMEAMEAARRHALHEILETGTLAAMVPFLPSVMDETRALLGDDFWPYGVERNHATLDRLLAYAQQQGLTRRRLQPEALFL
ncbi:MAG: ABC transporter substrate-binding protein [Ectothiorhodospiraceae bacterium]|nr:ABC transporter substrate-binding protein [Ectothiorhodospiraceae bacterium]